jgi:hypothetical protein
MVSRLSAHICQQTIKAPCIFHLTTFDAFFHVAIAGLDTLKSAAVLTFVSHVFLSDNLSSKPQDEFCVYAKIDGEGQRKPNITLSVYDNAIDLDFPCV